MTVEQGTLSRAKAMASRDSFPIKGFSHLEWWVGNAFQTAHFFRNLLGFRITGYRGPETGTRETASYLLEQGQIRFIVTGAMNPDHPVSEHVNRHGPGVHDVAILVPDAEAAFEIALERGADPATKPHVVEDARGRAVVAAIQAYGDTIHSFIEREGEIPGFEPREDTIAKSIGLEFIDHVVANVELGKMDYWVEFYERVFGFTLLKHFDDDAISTKYTALMSKVMWDGTGIIKLPINEPAEGLKRSQIDEYLQFYRGPGVQHIAMHTSDLLATVDHTQARAGNAERSGHLLRGHLAAHARHQGRSQARRGTQGAARPGRGWLPVADLHPYVAGSAHGVLRVHRAPRCNRIRQGQLQGTVRGHRAGAGEAGQPLIEIVEVGPRDGLQSETAVLPVNRRVELIRRMEVAGATRIETVSFAHPERVPQMAGAEQICESLRERSFSAIGLVLNDRGLDRALACDLDEINVVAYAADGYAQKNSGTTAAKRNAEAAALVEKAKAAGRRTSVTIAVAFGDPIDGTVALEHVAELTATFAAAGVDEVALGDTIGIANPKSVERLIPAVIDAAATATVRCHFHNTRNAGYANAVSALRCGVNALDAAVGGFGGSPFSPGVGGNVATEDLTALLRAMGISTAIDPWLAAETGTWLAGLLGHDRAPAMLGMLVDPLDRV